jgi:predicted nucleotidyltransferase
MAKGNFEHYLQHDLVRTKKYFYVLRPILACRWIEKYNEMAPMEFRVLLDDPSLEDKIRSAIENLLARKINGEELDKEPKIKALNDFLSIEISHFEDFVREVNPDANPITGKLNKVFRDSLDEAWKEE